MTGPSGSGKSTLLRCLNGLTPHFSGGTFDGIVTVAGHDTRHYSPRVLARLTGFVFQDPEAQRGRPRRRRARLRDGAARCARGDDAQAGRGGARSAGDRRIARSRDATLSGGERQRVAVAAALALQPSILALDEPTSQLDPWGAEEVLAALNRLNEDLGLTVVLAEHRLERVVAHADRLTVLAPEERSPSTADREIRCAMPRLGVSRRCSHSGDDWIGTPCRFPSRRASRPAPRRPRARARAGAARSCSPWWCTVVALQRVSAGWDRYPVLRGVDLDVRPGELLALMGRNGSGKTTLLRLVAGLHRPSSGRVLVAGRTRHACTPPTSPRRSAISRRTLGALRRDAAGRACLHPEAPSPVRGRSGGNAGHARAGACYRPKSARSFGRRAGARRAGGGARRRTARPPPRRADTRHGRRPQARTHRDVASTTR